jgi:TolB protein
MVRWILVLALTGACAVAASAASAPSGLIVFSSSSGVDGKTRVWVMNANGTARRAVTPPTSAAEDPALSRDGRRIAFVRRDDVYVMSLNGTQVRRLTFSSSAESSPSWSPDGRWIAYSSYRSGRSAIWKMRSDGGQKTLLAAGKTLSVPAWSPVGDRIAYAGVNGQIWMMNANGGGKRALTRTASGTGVDWAPSWSPDGRRIAYESDVGTGPRDLTNEIWVIGADGSHPARLTHNLLNDGQPDWSPDGAWLVFSSQRPHSGAAHLWLMRPNGKGLHRITPWAGEQYQPSWAR